MFALHSIHAFIHSFIRGNYYTMHSCFYLIRSKSIKTLLVLLWLLVTDQFKQFIDFNQSFDQIDSPESILVNWFPVWLAGLVQQMPEIVESLWTPFKMCTLTTSAQQQHHWKSNQFHMSRYLWNQITMHALFYNLVAGDHQIITKWCKLTFFPLVFSSC